MPGTGAAREMAAATRRRYGAGRAAGPAPAPMPGAEGVGAGSPRCGAMSVRAAGPRPRVAGSSGAGSAPRRWPEAPLASAAQLPSPPHAGGKRFQLLFRFLLPGPVVGACREGSLGRKLRKRLLIAFLVCGLLGP